MRKIGLVLLVFCGLHLSAHAAEVSVAVASNYSAPMQKLAHAFEQETGHKALLSFGSTGNLYAQIRNGWSMRKAMFCAAASLSALPWPTPSSHRMARLP